MNNTEHLPRLGDDAVAERLAAYSASGELQAALNWLWREAGGIIQEVVNTHFGESRRKHQGLLLYCWLSSTNRRPQLSANPRQKVLPHFRLRLHFIAVGTVQPNVGILIQRRLLMLVSDEATQLTAGLFIVGRCDGAQREDVLSWLTNANI